MRSLVAVLAFLTALSGLAHGQASEEVVQGQAAARLNAIAILLQNPSADPTPLITEACGIIGFAVWPTPTTTLKPPATNSPLHLAVTDEEIRDYGRMMQSAHYVTVGDMEASFDALLSKMGTKVSVKPSVDQLLTNSSASPNRSVRYLGLFLRDLNMAHKVGASPFFNDTTQLDPLQSLLLMRVISEDIGTPIRHWLVLHKQSNLMASINPQAPVNLPGWAEDAYAGVMGNLYSAINAWEDQPGSAGSKYLEQVGNLNAAMTVVKFIATYCKIKGEITLDPDPPLIRTKDTTAGAKAKVKATFTISSDATNDTLKDIRQYLLLLGIDSDAPKGGPLNGVETAWTLGQSTKFASRQLVQTDQDISKVITDDNGTATVNLEGKPQMQAVDSDTARAVTKHIQILVTPQAKRDEAKQDIVDATSLVLGIGQGGGAAAPWIPLVTETMYRMKWCCTAEYDLAVTDWVPGDLIGALTVDINVTGHTGTSSGSEDAAVIRNLTIPSVKMTKATAAIPTIDTSMYNSLPPEMKKQVMDAIFKAQAQAQKDANDVGYQSQTPLDWSASIQDLYQSNQQATTCSNETVYHSETMLGNGSGSSTDTDKKGGPSFSISEDAAKGVAHISFNCDLPVHKTFKTIDSAPGGNVDTTSDVSVNLMDGIILDKAAGKDGFEIPLTTSPIPGQPDQDISGAITIPIHYHAYAGNMIISYSLTRKKKGS